MKFYSVNLNEKAAMIHENETPEGPLPKTGEPADDSGEVQREQPQDQQIKKLVANFNSENIRTKGMATPTAEACDFFVLALRENGTDPLTFVEPLLQSIDSTPSKYDIKVEEICLEDYLSALSTADKNGYVNDGLILRSMGLSFVSHRRYASCFSDRIVDEDMTQNELFQAVEENHLGGDYKRELERIYSIGKVDHFIGHPAHYAIAAKNSEYRRSVARGLITALHEEGRLSSKRYTIFIIDDDPNPAILESIYKMNKGATVLLRAESGRLFANESNQISSTSIEDLLQIVRRYMPETLTIFSFDSLSDGEQECFRNALGHIAMVEFRADIYAKESAVAYVEKLAQKDGFTLDEDIKTRLLSTERGYLAEGLDAVYSEWKMQHLSTVLYPAYKGCYSILQSKGPTKKKTAFDELSELIGLKNAKKTIKQALDYYKLQQEYSARGMTVQKPNMHMVFTGNPGTAKTTVARLVARIFKENGLLSVGDLIEVGRKDIVGKYLGSTAPLVKEMFGKAKGSVLFIDEAYSLVDDKKGLYGDEAINTIVQLMENEREDMVVIFAGYTKEMEEFLDRNPGLRSRIAFHVAFDDYNESELCEITELFARKNGSVISPAAHETLCSIYKEQIKHPNFGNGRYARSLYEQAKMHLASRLGESDLSKVSREDLITLLPEDFSESYETQSKGESAPLRIGFGA